MCRKSWSQLHKAGGTVHVDRSLPMILSRCSRKNENESLESMISHIDVAAVNEYLKTHDKPFVLQRNVTQAEWNKFVKTYDGEAHRIQIRFMEYFKGTVQIVELFASMMHERTVRVFEHVFGEACGNVYAAMTSGSFTSHNMEPDCSYGPVKPTVPLPKGLKLVSYWRTFIVEIGYSQNMESLARKAAQWATVPGVKYILCMHVDKKLQSFAFKFFEVANDGCLTVEAESDHIEVNNQEYSPVYVVLDSRKLLGLCDKDVLPPGMKNLIAINLRKVVRLAGRNL